MGMRSETTSWNWIGVVLFWLTLAGCEGDKNPLPPESTSPKIHRVPTIDGNSGGASTVKEIIAAGKQSSVVNCCVYGEEFDQFLSKLEEFSNLEDLQISINIDEMSDRSWIKNLHSLPKLSRLVMNTSDLTDGEATDIASLPKLAILKVARLNRKDAIMLLLSSKSIKHLYLNSKWTENEDILAEASRRPELQLHFGHVKSGQD